MQGRIFFATLLAVTLSHNANAGNPIANFVKAEDGLYRGGSPGDAGIAYLKSLGVKTILNLDDRKDVNAEEKKAAASAGIREVSVPMSGFWEPEDRRINAALAALENSKLRPIFVHCQHGQDRTGLVLGLYRVESEHWQPGHAYEEMKSLGFHPILFLLNHYFEDRTGWDD